MTLAAPIDRRSPEPAPRRPRRAGPRAPGLVAGLACLAVTLQAGCGALLLVGGAGTSAIAFATGELRVTEAVPLRTLEQATATAVETLRYDDPEALREPDRVHFRATTAGGDPVVIRLIARGPERTDVRIRIGVFGNEARSRLVLEQIRQSL